MKKPFDWFYLFVIVFALVNALATAFKPTPKVTFPPMSEYPSWSVYSIVKEHTRQEVNRGRQETGRYP